MDFKKFKTAIQKHVARMLEDQEFLFVSDTDKDTLWTTYLNSFPKGTNEIFRERRYHECNCCKQFLRTVGNIMVIKNNKVVSIWDFTSEEYQPVIDALGLYVKSKPIKDVFITREFKFGTDTNCELLDDGSTLTWNHFFLKIPERFTTNIQKTIATEMAKYRDIKNVFKRSLEELSVVSIETLLDLIAQNSLYRGEEWQEVLTKFYGLHKKYHELQKEDEKDNFCWNYAVKVGGVLGKIKNHSIGVLLVDLSKGVELNQAVEKYENTIVAPESYKRQRTLYTRKMVDEAVKCITELGLYSSLGRRFATIGDISINDVLFANKDVKRCLTNNDNSLVDVFSEMKQEVSSINTKSFSKVEEVPAQQFIDEILPRVSNIEIFLENRHASNLVSLIGPSETTNSKTLFKWDNAFSWAYAGNITDSTMRERVKAAGGNVEGVLRFSIQWNENGDNLNDFDAHCIEPKGNEIFYPKKGCVQPSSGLLDVDIIHPRTTEAAVENITWTNIEKMQEGVYTFFVYNFCHRGGRSGFSAEIEYNDEIYSYKYTRDIPHKGKVVVAKVKFSRKNGIQFMESLDSTMVVRELWNLRTNQFHPVSVCTMSPNYWDQQHGIGNRHLFFMLKDCINTTQPNGFFNEFLREDLMPHKKFFEALGGKMRVSDSEDQLSGLGFCSTRRNFIYCKLGGAFTRTVKVVF